MTRTEVLERLCNLSTLVMEERFCCQIPADCFCDKSVNPFRDFQYHPEIIAFIENAVREKIEKVGMIPAL